MFSLEDLLGQEQGNNALGQISSMIGADQSATNQAIHMALPAILNGLANNASTEQGAQNLNSALERDHRGGGILEMLGGFLGGQSTQTKQTDGGGILGHIFGNNQGQVAQQISNNSGLDIGQVAQLLITLAPIVMGYLGKQKQEQNLGADGLSSWLGGQQEQIQQSPQGGFLTNLLDQDGDGSAMDDIASMAFKYMTNR